MGNVLEQKMSVSAAVQQKHLRFKKPTAGEAHTGDCRGHVSLGDSKQLQAIMSVCRLGGGPLHHSAISWKQVEPTQKVAAPVKEM